MKLEKIAQLLDISSNNNSSTSNKNISISQSTSAPMHSVASASDILSYNLVAGKYISMFFNYNRIILIIATFL
jgi:hypothetical protein